MGFYDHLTVATASLQYPDILTKMSICQDAYFRPLSSLVLDQDSLYSCVGTIDWCCKSGFSSNTYQIASYKEYVPSVKQAWHGLLQHFPDWTKDIEQKITRLRCVLEVYVSPTHYDVLVCWRNVEMYDIRDRFCSVNRVVSLFRSYSAFCRQYYPSLRLGSIYASVKGCDKIQHVHGSRQLYVRIAGQEFSWSCETANPALFGYYNAIYNRVVELVGPPILQHHVAHSESVWCLTDPCGMLGLFFQKQGYQLFLCDGHTQGVFSHSAFAYDVEEKIKKNTECPEVVIWNAVEEATNTKDFGQLFAVKEFVSYLQENSVRIPRMIVVILRLSIQASQQEHIQDHVSLLQLLMNTSYVVRQVDGWKHAAIAKLPSHLPQSLKNTSKKHRKHHQEISVLCVLTPRL